MLGKNIYSVSREKNNDTAMAEHNNFHKHKMQQLEAERHHSVIMSLKPIWNCKSYVLLAVTSAL